MYSSTATATDERRCLDPLLLLLSEAHHNRVALTRHGRLTATSGRLLTSKIDSDARWLPPYEKDAHDHLVDSLVVLTERLGLVRREGRDLLISHRGRKARKNIPALWSQFASLLPFETDEYGIDVAQFLLVLVASGLVASEASAVKTIDHLVVSAGWMFSNDSVEDLNSIGAARLTLASLQLAGARDIAEAPSEQPAYEPLAARGAVFLASSSLANDRATRRPPAAAR
ncbi:hypothetical protein [Subtercola sp. Z020]|uniref:hypothetical protein n=1 Tax=Subtercola sp. Z020 TaxID=2080582 RepID=UPI0011B02708|nr:hypothetical protein [Subtercola sp. Z020]